jgi:hypothetical protein
VKCATLGNNGSSVGQVTTEPGNVRRRQSETIKFTKKHCTRNWIESVAKIEVNDINRKVGMNQASNGVKISNMNQASNGVKISNKICRCKFRFDRSVLMRIKFGLQMARNVLNYDKLIFFGKGFEKSDKSVINH